MLQLLQGDSSGGVSAKMKTSIVAGGAGFIGSHLCEYLLNKGEQVICIDNLLTGRKENIDPLIGEKGFTFLRQDIVDQFSIHNDIDYVYHLASPASPIDYLKYPIETLKAGSFGTFNLLELARRNNARFLLASTSEVYGNPQETPQREEYLGNVNTIGVRGVYDEAKRYSEALVMAYHREFSNMKTRMARIFNTFGPGMRLDDGRAVPNFIGQALRGDPITVYGEGTQTRSFCYITDMLDGLYELMMSDYHLPLNLGNPEEMSIIKFAGKIKALCHSGSRIEYKPLPQDDPLRRKPDITKAQDTLGFHPRVTLEDGLKKTIDWFAKVR